MKRYADVRKRRARVVLLLLAMLGIAQVAAWAADAPAPAVNSGATAWMLTSTALVLLMVPGLAMFYGGLVRTKNVLGTMMHSFSAMAIMGVLWVVCGYAMSFGKSACGGWCGWDWNYFLMRGIDEKVMPSGVPEYVFAMFQGKFAIITPALIAGAFAERVRFRTYCVFIALWGLLVYNPLCHWVWAADGFLFNMGANGAIDFAGGTVVHISSGVSGLVLALFLGARRGYPATAIQPNNLVMTLSGAGLLWVGWFGFNAGSSVASDLLTAQALTATQAAASSGALTWMLIEALHQGKATSLGVASGILAGLVAVTPAAGVVQPFGALCLGAAAALACFTAIQMKTRMGYDDSLDAFGVHGVGGIVGSLLLTFFIRKSWMAAAAAKTGAGAWGVFDQLKVQVAAVGIAVCYAAAVTLVLVFVLDRVLGLRLEKEDEMSGMDHCLHGEQAYGMLNLG